MGSDALAKWAKRAVVAHGPSLGRKRPRSALQQSLAALRHIMKHPVRSRKKFVIATEGLLFFKVSSACIYGKEFI
jgi:hypothetical protein